MGLRKDRMLAACAVLALTGAGARAATFADIDALLQARCVMCHNGAVAPLGLRLDSLEGLLAGSQNGPVVKAGDPAGSELLRRLTGESSPRMPMTGPPFLSEAEIALFRDWIVAGMPEGEAPAAGGAAPAGPAMPGPGDPVTYAHVAPLLAVRCAKCHAQRGLMGPAPEGYRLTSWEETVSVVDRARVVPGQPDASELVRRIRGQARPRMPLDGPPYLSEEEIRLVERWIQQGAPDARGVAAAPAAGARVRLHGMLQAGRRLDELPLLFTSRTRRDDSPAPGDYVEVRGRIGADGSVIVERIRAR